MLPLSPSLSLSVCCSSVSQATHRAAHSTANFRVRVVDQVQLIPPLIPACLLLLQIFHKIHVLGPAALCCISYFIYVVYEFIK